ncbi:MAG: hypothetical protein J6S67_07585 [Methanobrevibacter sp.]|nr:hypothetical protein [Methanobrevibacter sp.]
MTLKELQAKNLATRKRKAAELEKEKEKEVLEVPVVEDADIGIEPEEESEKGLYEEKKGFFHKHGKKPHRRQYMVVEDIEDVNKP